MRWFWAYRVEWVQKTLTSGRTIRVRRYAWIDRGDRRVGKVLIHARTVESAKRKAARQLNASESDVRVFHAG